MEGLHSFKNINMFKPLAFKIKGDFGTVYITESGIKDVAPEGVLYVNNIHPDDDIIDRDSFRYNIILTHLYDILDHKYKCDGNVNNIDISISLVYYENKYNIDIKIYHGDIEITNTLGHKSLLKEVYTNTLIYADEKSIKFRDLKIFRTRINKAETANNFFHSHSPSIRVINLDWYSMCLGDSALFNHFFKKKRKHTDMSLYSAYLDAYLAWESKEGGPYNTIESVYNCSNDRTNINANIDNLNVDDLIYKYADVFQVIDYYGKLSISSDFMNHIEIEGIPKTNSYGNYFDFKLLKPVDEWLNQDSYNSNILFRGIQLKLTIENIDKEKFEPYISTMYNKPPEKVMDIIKMRVSSIINLNYEKNNREQLRNIEATEQR
jgi:hypothetical protein